MGLLNVMVDRIPRRILLKLVRIRPWAKNKYEKQTFLFNHSKGFTGNKKIAMVCIIVVKTTWFTKHGYPAQKFRDNFKLFRFNADSIQNISALDYIKWRVFITQTIVLADRFKAVTLIRLALIKLSN